MRSRHIFLVAVLTVCCARRQSPDVLAPVACPTPSIPGSDWQEARFSWFTVDLPPGFTREPDLYCEHGGEYYVRGRERFGYCNNMFSDTAQTVPAGEEVITFLGQPALMRCARSGCTLGCDSILAEFSRQSDRSTKSAMRLDNGVLLHAAKIRSVFIAGSLLVNSQAVRLRFDPRSTLLRGHVAQTVTKTAQVGSGQQRLRDRRARERELEWHDHEPPHW